MTTATKAEGTTRTRKGQADTLQKKETTNGTITASLKLVESDELGAHYRGTAGTQDVIVSFETDKPGHTVRLFAGPNAAKDFSNYIAEHRERIFPVVLDNCRYMYDGTPELDREAEAWRQIVEDFNAQDLLVEYLREWGDAVRCDMTPGHAKQREIEYRRQR